jgi:hypothetical protein
MSQTEMKLAEISTLKAAQMTGNMSQTVMKLAEISALQTAQMTGKHEPNSDETGRDLRPAGCTNNR